MQFGMLFMMIVAAIVVIFVFIMSYKLLISVRKQEIEERKNQPKVRQLHPKLQEQAAKKSPK